MNDRVDPGGIRDILHRYYEAWARQDREAARALLADALDFRSPQDRFTSADAFLQACWHHADGLAGVRFLREIVDGEAAFVILEWRTANEGRFCDAEYVETEDGVIRSILVVNNSPTFSGLVDPLEPPMLAYPGRQRSGTGRRTRSRTHQQGHKQGHPPACV